MGVLQKTEKHEKEAKIYLKPLWELIPCDPLHVELKKQ